METGGSKGVEVCSSLIEKQDLVVEFLSRLPVKSLCRFRCVSKEWDALIKSSYFMALHHSLSPNLSLILGSYLFIDNSFFLTCDYQVSSLCVEEDTPILKSISPLPQLMHRTKASIDIAASINGLVLLRSISWCKDFGLFDEDIIVWNPATTKLRYLPKHLDSKCSSDHVRVVLGFGFINGIGSEYKVVRIWPTPNNVDGKSTYKTLVFTQGTDSWRQAQACIPTCAHKCLIQCSSSTTLNGELYFCAINSERYVDCVLSYNLRDEVFKVVTLPSNLPNSSMYLHSWNNSLALVTTEVVSRERDGGANVVCRYSSKAEVWVMRNKESAESCWEIQFTIPTEINVLGFLKDKILAYHNEYRQQYGDLLMHDPQSLKDRNLSTHVGGVGHRPFRLVPYVETLFPVDG